MLLERIKKSKLEKIIACKGISNMDAADTVQAIEVSGGTIDVTVNSTGVDTITLISGDPSIRSTHEVDYVVEDDGTFLAGGFEANGENLNGLITGVAVQDNGPGSVDLGWFHADFPTGDPANRSAGAGADIISVYLPTANVTGAGIVSGSKPEEEWNEIETKISDFLTLFDSPA